MGVRKGVPDLILDVPRQGFHGLRIELKAPMANGKKAGELSKEQLEWLNALSANGYRAVACWGWETARDTILDYLDGKP